MNIVSPSGTLVVVGNVAVTHVGAHLAHAATALGYLVIPVNSEMAFSGGRLIRSMSWRLRGHRPARLCAFSDQVVEVCRTERPRWMLTTGIAPVAKAALDEIKRLGICRLNYLTDDPWNPAHAASWFMDALRQYDWIFSTRTSNLADLRRHGCAQVSYLPFAYAPHLHYSEPLSAIEQVQFGADIVFVGGADPDPLPLITELIRSGFEVALYGGYWDRYSETRRVARGHADQHTLRKAVAGSRVTLSLVRRANRDGSAMRTFEVAAMGACMLVEDTDEHRQILGEDGYAVVYFRSPEEMVQRLHWLLDHDSERRRLAATVHARITSGHNTYSHRLQTMLTISTADSRL